MDYCSAHSNLPDGIRFGSPEQASKAGASPKPHRPRPREIFDAVAEQYAPHIIARYLETMSATKPFTTGSGDDVFTEQGPDYAIRLRAAVDFLDRWMGKATDKLEMSGPEGGPIEIDTSDIQDPEARKLAHELLKRRAGSGGS
jgi:hypothetical protein